nr:MAG TPA: hypothetical protein [Caudoviricetes sp.]
MQNKRGPEKRPQKTAHQQQPGAVLGMKSPPQDPQGGQ